MFKTFKDMPIWQKAMETAQEIHHLTSTLPRSEDYGFTSQIRRSALSISANIAEAFGRNHKRDKINFYYVSRGSATETQSHLEYAKRVGYMDRETASKLDQGLTDLYNSINKVIAALRVSKR
jgi:four helix bundle protein